MRKQSQVGKVGYGENLVIILFSFVPHVEPFF